MNWITLLGLCAAGCTTIAFLPQVIKTIRTKQTKDISFWMYFILVLGILLWLIYGILIGDIPLIVANTVTFLLAGMVFVLKLKYK
jgi:MtN3 and saliva related transmembrane protein